jgi:colanic acid biosynthesis glycosyl transferase WcaI
MNVLVISDYYHPDGSPVSPAFKSLCENLALRGHSISVITTVPHYPSGFVNKYFKGKKVHHSVEQGVHITRVPLPSVDRSKLYFRAIQFVVFQALSIINGPKEPYQVVLTHTPALEIFFPFIYFSWFKNKPAVYSVADIYPDVGIRMGVFQNPIIIKLVSALEGFCLRKAQKVRILSDSFKTRILEYGVKAENIELIYDWVYTDNLNTHINQNSLLNELNLESKFSVLYAGNHGFAQALDSVIEAANLLREEKEILFIFVGDGAAKEGLIKRAREYDLSNVIFLPYMDREKVTEIISACNVSLITLKKGIAFGALPSKTFSILLSGRPVIASVDEGSDTWNLIGRAQAGICISPEKPDELIKAILELKDNPERRSQMGESGRNYVLSFHTPQYAADKFEVLLEQAVSGNGRK